MAWMIANRTFPRSYFFFDQYRVPKCQGSQSQYEELEEEEYNEKVIIVFDDDEDANDESDKDLGEESSKPESCVTDSELDPKDKISVWMTRAWKHALAGIWSFQCMLPRLMDGPSIT